MSNYWQKYQHKFTAGQCIRVESSDRAGYNFGNIMVLTEVYGEMQYGIQWDDFSPKVHYYVAKEVDDIWEAVGRNVFHQDIKFTGIEPTFDEFKGLPTINCIHDWKEYQGFSDSFEYCTKCDEKRKRGN